MAEFTNGLLQAVAAGGNVLFTETPVCPGPCIHHRAGSGVLRLKGATNQRRALYKVTFGANVAIPEGGTVAPVMLAISVDGEPLASATMIETPAAAEEFSNVFSAVLIAAECGCCATVAVVNIGEDSIDVQNANLIVERVA